MANKLKPCPFCGGEATHGAEVEEKLKELKVELRKDSEG